MSFSFLEHRFGFRYGEKITYSISSTKSFSSKEYSNKLMFSYLSGGIVLSTSSIADKHFSYLAILDVDCAYDPEKLFIFQRALYEMFSIKSFSNRSLGGRIHIYIPFQDKVFLSKMMSFADVLSKFANKYFECPVEYVPNGKKQISLFNNELDCFDNRGLSKYSFFHKNEKVAFKKKLDFLVKDFFGKGNKERIVDDVLKKVPLLQQSVQYVSEVHSFFEKSSVSEIDLVPVTSSQKESLLTDIAHKLKSYYERGNRNNIIFAFSGLAAIMKVDFNRFLDICKTLLSNDEEYRKRISTIARAFDRVKKGEKVSFSLLYEYLPEYSFKFLFISNDNYQKSIKLLSVVDKSDVKASKKAIDIVLSDIVFKSVVFGKRFVLGYNALSKKGISKRDISNILKFLQERKILILVAKGRWFESCGEKISLGTVFELFDLDSVFSYKLPNRLVDVLKDSLDFYIGVFMFNVNKILKRRNINRNNNFFGEDLLNFIDLN